MSLSITFTQQPQSQSVSKNSSVTLSVVVSVSGGSGSETLSYQWCYDQADYPDAPIIQGFPIQGATSSSYQFTADDETHLRLYSCEVVATDNGVTKTGISNSAKITLTDATSISFTAQPANASAVLHQEDATFYASATGSGSIAFYWETKFEESSEWTTVNNATETTSGNISTLVYTPGQNDNGRLFRCCAWNCNDIGSSPTVVTSNSATLTVTNLDTQPQITGQPQNVTVAENQNGSFWITATGGGLSYQWQTSSDNGTTWTDILGAIGSTYIFQATREINGHQFRCIATNTIGSATSNTATLVVSEDPSVVYISISQHPVDQTVDAGEDASFSVTAASELEPALTLYYQWQSKANSLASWSDLTNKTDASLTVETTDSMNRIQFRCRITDLEHTVYSEEAYLYVNAADPPVITYQPTSVNVRENRSASFSIGARGDSLSYQWQVSTNSGTSWSNISGATSMSYTIARALLNMSGYLYRCVITNTHGSVTSSAVQLIVRPAQIQPIIQNSGYHSIIISGKNTYYEWQMYPTSRPHVVSPEVKTTYVDLPGADGGFDYTELLTGKPNYNYRKGSWEFLLIPQDQWANVYRNLELYLHGRIHSIILEDDPNYVYTGRLSINSWKSQEHYSTIVIDYVLEPERTLADGSEQDDEYERQIRAAKALLLRPEYAGQLIMLENNTVVFVYPQDLYDDGDNIAY